MFKNKKLHPIKLTVASLIIIGLGFAGYTHFFMSSKREADLKTPTPSTTRGGASTNDSKGEVGPEATTGSAQTQQPGDNKSNQGGTDSLSLMSPSGEFVSNHSPGKNGSPLGETSVCTTTPGASCTISFTNSGVTKSLPAQITDRGGSAYWNWSVDDPTLGLTPGIWLVKATASLQGISKTTTDSMNLMVSQ